jgi:predicted HTH domain antitoxin
LAAAIHWYSQGQISQGKAAEIAGVSRAEFLEELFQRKIPAVQVTLEELRRG